MALLLAMLIVLLLPPLLAQLLLLFAMATARIALPLLVRALNPPTLGVEASRIINPRSKDQRFFDTLGLLGGPARTGSSLPNPPPLGIVALKR